MKFAERQRLVDLGTYVEIKLTIQVPPEKVNCVSDELLAVLDEQDVFNGTLEQGKVELHFDTPITNEDNLK